MLVFWKQQLVLLATPKTGTTAIEATLAPVADIAITNPPRLKHTGLQRYHRFLLPYLEPEQEFETAAVIREPRDWLGSWFRYRQRPGVDASKATTGMTFDAFVRAYLDDSSPAFATVGSQARFLRARGDKKVTHLFRHDRMDDLVAFLEHRLGRRIELPRLNVSPKADLSLTPETDALLKKVCAADFALYDSCA